MSAAIDDSVALGKQVSAIMLDPTKLSRKELVAKLDQLSAPAGRDRRARRAAGNFQGTLEDEQTVFSTGMKVRASGFRLLRTAIVGALGNEKIGVKQITALDGYFSGPDAYYQELVYLPARQTMADDGVTDVAVPTSTYYLTWKALDPATVTAMLDNVGKSPKLTGIHGVAVLGVTAKSSSGDIKLVKGRTNDVPASADLAFVVQVQNQGSVAENEVPVTATLTLPGSDPIKQSAPIATIEAGKTQDVTISGFAIPTEALSKEVTLKVVAGPVKGERVETNNTVTYKLLLQLK